MLNMCFSAGASFALSSVLYVGGIVALKKITKPKQIPFALIPVLFAIQQYIEGIVWLSLTKDNYHEIHLGTTYFFLVFAQVIWPFWVPFSILLIEKDGLKKKILKVLLFIGIAVSIYRTYCLIFYTVSSEINAHHISYSIEFSPKLKILSAVLYFIPIVLTPYVSSDKKINIIGWLLLISFLTTVLFYKEYLISVWCYYAAAISITVLYVLFPATWQIFKKRKIKVN